MNGIGAVIGDYAGFVNGVHDGLARCGILPSELSMMDHICYRVETEERYQQIREQLKRFGVLIGENEVSGRLIATFELDEYLQVGDWTIPYIELPAPKEGSPYREGLEHAELVVVGSLGHFKDRHKDLPFSQNGMNKAINPEISLKAEGVSVKFHEQQLGAVVRIENRLQKGEVV